MKKLAILSTHPIQYYAPVFALLAQQKDIDVKVFYTWGAAAAEKYDPGFGTNVSWDIPLLEGYAYDFLENTAKDPGSHHRNGIINPTLITKINIYQPDAILVYGWAYKSHLKALRYFKGKIPVWFRGDSNLMDEKAGLKNILKSLFLTWVYRHVDKAFYVGTQNKHYFLKYGLKSKKLVFAPHAIDNHRFAQNRSEEALALRNQLGIKPDEILILFAGKFEPKKNPDLLLDAFLKINLDGVHLLFVGNGVLEESLKSKANAIQKPSMATPIHFMDFQNQSQMPVIYQACNLFCLPSKGPGETWGLAINEAMAAGKAILSSDKTGAAIDLVKPGENGFIFSAGNLEDLQQKLTLLCENKAELEKMGTRSKAMIGNWDFEAQVNAITKELRSL